MNLETILNTINLYGYFIISFFLFLGIVGIPAPEESLLFLIGVLIVHHKLSFGSALLYSIIGTFIGMLTAYTCGKFVGYPFIKKFGKYIGITNANWDKARDKYTKHVRKTILLGFYMPGIRQISPYFAGVANFRFKEFILFSLLGTIFWTVPYIMAGYYAGEVFNINPKYVPYFGILFFIIFLVYVFIKYQQRNKNKDQN